jgi:hypothetical protein
MTFHTDAHLAVPGGSWPRAQGALIQVVMMYDIWCSVMPALQRQEQDMAEREREVRYSMWWWCTILDANARLLQRQEQEAADRRREVHQIKVL